MTDEPRREMGPIPTKGPVYGRLHHAWRVSFFSVAWHLTKAVVWAKSRVHLLSWLGGDGREIAVRLWTIGWLTFVWVLLWGTISWANILGGVAVAVVILVLLPLPRVPVEGRIHPATVVLLVAYLIRDFFVSSAEVAWLAVRPRRPPLSAVLRTRLAIKSDMVLTLAVDYINLVPGTMVVEIDHRRRLLYVHLIDVSSEKKVRAFYRQMETVERLFIRAFERDSEWHPSPYHGLDDEFHGAAPVRSDPHETRGSVPEAKGDRR
ncbi:Na+/H+ antiporter subunit E [Williamsia herbipolensis]|uniref:Na+/H+ antiporter subunit E n=1 Tax=Williamsia herbipolensis TaxID=1603258 RepID=A0AAU4JZP9_9NOCA|nr:Na+/H+ antiporter subunit E [Williamsia herbipolensis]MCX6468425.1 Na+/H+ antiporter subunit E [Mycobacteriales bacterium]